MTINPAKLLGIDKGSIEVGKDADITILDPDEEFEIDSSKFASKGKNTPFNGFKAKGRILYTLVGGDIKVLEGELFNDNR